MKKISMGLFGLAYAAELLAHLLSMPAWHWIAKPLIVIALLLYYTAHARVLVSGVIVSALLLSLAGDVLLMLNSKHQTCLFPGWWHSWRRMSPTYSVTGSIKMRRPMSCWVYSASVIQCRLCWRARAW
ncbi:MAG: hypothetical protein HC859_10045 [Bacteroidia bacterium]|nr:hypothetical protein [Bacteroidia bacterium]